MPYPPMSRGVGLIYAYLFALHVHLVEVPLWYYWVPYCWVSYCWVSYCWVSYCCTPCIIHTHAHTRALIYLIPRI